MKESSSLFGFLGRVTILHFLTYFFVGFLFYVTGLNAVVYFENHPDPIVTSLLRPTSSDWVLAGPLFQLIRGVIFALALFPFRRIFLERKWGWIYLWGLFLALAIFAPSGPSPGSVEGFVYTELPVLFHLIALPEIVLQTLAFSWLVVTWEHRKDKRLTIALLAVFVVILIFSLSALFL